MTEKSALPAWVWPIKLDDYDRNPELNSEEAETLRSSLPSLANAVPPSIVIEKCGLPRLMKPLEDVCTHIELQRKYWPNLKALMIRDVAERGRSFWGWSEKEWLDSIKRGGHEKPSVAAAAYLLCRFDSLHELGRYNFLFYGLAIRIFGRKRIRSLFAELGAMLVEWGYRDRTARIYIPRAMCEVLVTNRSPHLEDLTFELLQKVQQRRQKKTSTLPNALGLDTRFSFPENPAGNIHPRSNRQRQPIDVRIHHIHIFLRRIVLPFVVQERQDGVLPWHHFRDFKRAIQLRHVPATDKIPFHILAATHDFQGGLAPLVSRGKIDHFAPNAKHGHFFHQDVDGWDVFAFFDRDTGGFAGFRGAGIIDLRVAALAASLSGS